MKAIIMAAGYATRMYPLTENTPKPLLPVNGKPIITHIIGKVLEIPDVNGIYIVTNAKFHSHFESWKSTFHCNIPITIVNDGSTSNNDRLGSIGDKHLVLEKEKIDDDVIDIAGDNLFNFSLKEMVDYYKKHKKATIGLYDVREISEARKMGIAAINHNNIVVGFAEKPEHPVSTLTSVGIYIYPKNARQLFSQYIAEGHSPDLAGYFVQWLHKKEDVHGYTFNKPHHVWYDIGSFEKYLEAQRVYSNG